jgi:hypothetical protein
LQAAHDRIVFGDSFMSKSIATAFHGLEPDTVLFSVESSDFKTSYNWSRENGEASDISMSISGIGHSPDAMLKLLGTAHKTMDYGVQLMPDVEAEAIWQNRQQQDADFWKAQMGKLKPHEEAVLDYQRQVQAVYSRFATDVPTAYLDMVLKDEGRQLAGTMLYILVTRPVWGLVMTQLEKGKNPVISLSIRWEATLTNKNSVLPGEPLTFGMSRIAETNIPMCGRVLSIQVQI